jgi:hypothetical protein
MSVENRVIFVLTGPREGFTGVLGGRYGFDRGELTVEHSLRDPLRIILCNNYACNIKGEAPLWKTVDGASVKITDVEKPEKEVTTVKTQPEMLMKDDGEKIEPAKKASPEGSKDT